MYSFRNGEHQHLFWVKHFRYSLQRYVHFWHVNNWKQWRGSHPGTPSCLNIWISTSTKQKQKLRCGGTLVLFLNSFVPLACWEIKNSAVRWRILWRFHWECCASRPGRWTGTLGCPRVWFPWPPGCRRSLSSCRGTRPRRPAPTPSGRWPPLSRLPQSGRVVLRVFRLCLHVETVQK